MNTPQRKKSFPKKFIPEMEKNDTLLKIVFGREEKYYLRVEAAYELIFRGIIPLNIDFLKINAKKEYEKNKKIGTKSQFVFEKEGKFFYKNIIF